MIKPVLTITSLIAGGAIFGMLASIKLHPFALTSLDSSHAGEAFPGEIRPASSPDGSEITIVRSERGNNAPHITLPEVTVTGEQLGSRAVNSTETQYARRAASPKAVSTESGMAPQRDWVPCSPWRELGPKMSEVNGTGDAHRVRQLC